MELSGSACGDRYEVKKTTFACTDLVLRDSRKFCQRGSSFDSLMRGGNIQIPLLAGHQGFAGGPMVAQHGNQCWLGSFVIFQGNPTSIAKEPYIFLIFQGRGSGPPALPPPPLDPHMLVKTNSSTSFSFGSVLWYTILHVRIMVFSSDYF